MGPRNKWYLICCPFFLFGAGLIVATAKFRQELTLDSATVLFYAGALISSISLSIQKIKGNELDK